MLRQGDMVLCTVAFRHLPFAQQLAVARDAGFQGISLPIYSYSLARGQGLSERSIRQMINDHGLEVDYLDGLLHWIPQAPRGQRIGNSAVPELDLDQVFEAAVSLGVSLINAVEVFGYNPGHGALAEAFGTLCDRAAAHGLRVALEFTPIGAVPDLSAAAAILNLAGRGNGGVLFDTWHFKRAGCRIAEIETLAAGRYFAIQLSDTLETPAANMMEETLHHRLLPGTGTANVAATLEALSRHGVRLPYGVEVFSDALQEEPPVVAAGKMLAAVRSVAPRQL